MEYGLAAAPDGASSPAVRSARGFRFTTRMLASLVGSTEVAMIMVGSALGPALFGALLGTQSVAAGEMMSVGLLSSIVYVALAKSFDLYAFPVLVNPAGHVRRIGAVCGLDLLGFTLILFLLKIGASYPRVAVIGCSAAMLVLCLATRVAAAAVICRLMNTQAIVGSPALVIGDEDELRQLTPGYLLRNFGLREVGRVPFDLGEGVARVQAREAVLDAMQVARARHASEFVVATRWDDPPRLARIVDALRISPLPARLLPGSEHRALVERYAPVQDVTRHLLDLQRAPMGIVERFGKRALDIAGASAALLVLLPVFGVVACAIALDSRGPIIFRQRRNGFDQRQFTILKFRTMSVLEDGDVVVQARRGDSRVTRVGRFLRRTSIDELPQLVNVLRGEMSLVGPRPHALAHDREYNALIDDYCMRHHVKPGITGWAQVNGMRGETAAPEMMERRVDLDLWYINNRSLLLDMRILLLTCVQVLGHNAY